METESDQNAAKDLMAAERYLGGPAWRWNRAGELLHARPGQHLEQFGREFCDAHHYRRLCAYSAVGEKHARSLYPQIVAAVELNGDTSKTGHLKIVVLGELDFQEVRERLGVDPVVANLWEKLFFDVRGLRFATAWMKEQMIGPEFAAGRGDLAARLRMVCAVGPAAARAILRADMRLPMDESQRLFERKLKLSLKFDAAVEMTADTEKSRLFFMRQHATLMLEEKRLELARQKLEKKCEEALDRHKLAMIRAEIALQRERNRAAAKVNRDEGTVLAKAGETAGREWLAAQHREQKRADEAVMAARIAASPLSRLRWRHPETLEDAPAVPNQPAVMENDSPSVIAFNAVRRSAVSPPFVEQRSTAVPA